MSGPGGGQFYFPPEIIFTSVLTRLPPESLLRFQAVSKSWESEINGPDFIKRHLDHQLETYSSNPKLVSMVGRSSFCVVEGIGTPNLAVRTFPEIPFPFCISVNNPIIGCPSNGLVALQGSSSSDDVAIWNPYLRSCRRVPVTPRASSYPLYSPLGGFLSITFRVLYQGFGYDSSHDDYKLVRVLRASEIHSKYASFSVYSMGSDSWSPVKVLPIRLKLSKEARTQKECVVVNQALHWLCFKRPRGTASLKKFVLAFNLQTEEFRGIEQPEYYGRSPGVHVKLANLRGELCAAEVNTDGTDTRFDVWVMKEYGVNDSWCLVRRVNIWLGLKRINKTVRPVVFSEDGTRVLLEVVDQLGRYRYYWFDMENKSSEQVLASDFFPGTSRLHASVGSLVQPDGGRSSRKRKLIV